MWEEGYLKDGDELDFRNPPRHIEPNRGNRVVGKGNRTFGFTTNFIDATQPYRKADRLKVGAKTFYTTQIRAKPYENYWLLLVMEDGERYHIEKFNNKKEMLSLRHEWVETVSKNGDFIKSIIDNEPVRDGRILNYLKVTGGFKPLKFSLVPYAKDKYLIVEGQEFSKPIIWRMNKRQYRSDLKSPSLAIYQDWEKHFSTYYTEPEVFLDPNWLENTGVKELLLKRQGKRDTLEGFDVFLPEDKHYMKIGGEQIFNMGFQFSGRKIIKGAKKFDRMYFMPTIIYPHLWEKGIISKSILKNIDFNPPLKAKVIKAAIYAKKAVSIYEKKYDDGGDNRCINPNRPSMPIDLPDKIWAEMRRIILK